MKQTQDIMGMPITVEIVEALNKFGAQALNDLFKHVFDYFRYVDEKFSHCGVNSFQLVKGDRGWQIVYLIDTRRKDDCGSLVQ